MINIIGNGISAIIISHCLNKLNVEHKIYGSGVFYAPELLYLKNDKYALFSKYPKELVTIGYIDDSGNVTTTLSDDMYKNYLAKQNRQVTDSAISDGLSSFKAINLKQFYNDFDKSKIIDKKVSLSDFDTSDIVLNTVFPYDESKEPNWLYIKNTKNDTQGFSYIYDCRDNDIKRITKNTIEYIKPQENTIKIKNYYDSPEIKIRDNIIYLSRNASQTQLKVEDIIDYILYGSKIREN